MHHRRDLESRATIGVDATNNTWSVDHTRPPDQAQEHHGTPRMFGGQGSCASRTVNDARTRPLVAPRCNHRVPVCRCPLQEMEEQTEASGSGTECFAEILTLHEWDTCIEDEVSQAQETSRECATAHPERALPPTVNAER